MYKNHRIAVIIPAYNEARHIGKVIQTMPDFVDDLIVVDDCSQDNTAEAAQACADSRVRVLHTPHNQGVGSAMVLGYRKSVELPSDITVKVDGDGQMLPEYMPALLDTLIEGGYEYAKGNRFLATDNSIRQMPAHRLIGNVVLTFLTKLASGYWHIFDPQNGYTAIKTDVLRALDLSAIHHRYFFENDMLIALNLQRRRVKDVAIPARYCEEDSKLNSFHACVTFPLLFLRRFVYRVYQRYVLRDFSPIALFLLLGSLLFAWGAVFGAYHWIKSIATGRPTLTGTIMVAILPLILGFQLLLQAIVLDIQETPR